MKKHLKTNRYEFGDGFTLVELAIVITIIGLLIGGILKGQELLANARVTATLSQIKSYQAALTTFKDIYQGQMPGDMRNPSTQIPNCTVAPCINNGSGNQIIDDALPFLGIWTYTGNNSEHRRFWLHLALSNLIGGINTSVTTLSGMGSWGVHYPAAKLGGGFHVAYYSIAAAPYGPTGHHYIQLQANPGPFILSAYTLTPARAAQMDRKMDDGMPTTGDVWGLPLFDDDSCVNATTGLYNEAKTGTICNMTFRID